MTRRYITWSAAALLAVLALAALAGQGERFEPPSARIARACDDRYPSDVDAARRCAAHLTAVDAGLRHGQGAP